MGSVELGAAVRRLRLERGLSFRELRDLSGCSVSHLQRIEGGRVAQVSVPVLRRLARALGADVSVLMRAAGYL